MKHEEIQFLLGLVYRYGKLNLDLGYSNCCQDFDESRETREKILDTYKEISEFLFSRKDEK